MYIATVQIVFLARLIRRPRSSRCISVSLSVVVRCKWARKVNRFGCATFTRRPRAEWKLSRALLVREGLSRTDSRAGPMDDFCSHCLETYRSSCDIAGLDGESLVRRALTSANAGWTSPTGSRGRHSKHLKNDGSRRFYIRLARVS